MAESIIFNGQEISNEVEAMAATHEMYAGGRQADTITLTFSDDDGLWDKWKPATGDTLIYSNGGTSTGKMFIYDPEPSNGIYILRATALPQDAKLAHSKSWEQVYLSQFGTEVAARSGLTFELYGLENIYYNYMRQDAEPDIAFLRRIAELEGGGITVYDGRLIMFKESYLESQEPTIQLSTIGATFEPHDYTGNLYGAAEVRSGIYRGKFSADEENKRILQPDPRQRIMCTSNAEATRYAAGLLRMANKGTREARMQSTLMAELSAGICISLDNPAIPSWGGSFFVHHLRHEYHKETTTLFMRRPLEGY